MTRLSSHITISISRLALAAGLACATAAFGTASRVAAATPAIDRFHVALTKAEPKANDTLSASPKAIKLWFSEPVQQGATAIRLTNAAGTAVTLGKVTIDAAAKSPATAAIPAALSPGRYTVAWRTMANDGHPAKGELTFVVR